MSLRLARMIGPLFALLLSASLSCAGGMDPREMPAQAPVAREKVSATPAQTSAAVSRARQAVAPTVREEPAEAPRPRAVPVAGQGGWQYSPRKGACEPLANVSRQVKNIGSFATPQEFARQMQQRGYQAFVLDIGATRDQEVRVKVPDLQLDLMFVQAGLCR